MLNYIDLIVTVLVLLLGFKGIVNGFTREFTSLVAIVGGVFAASHAAVPLARWSEAHLVRLNNPAWMELLAFLAVLLLVWGSMTLLGRLLLRNEEESPSLPSRILGFLAAGSKYFLILAIIAAALSRTSLVREKLSSQSKSSILYPILIRTGSLLIQLPQPLPVPKSGKTKTPHPGR